MTIVFYFIILTGMHFDRFSNGAARCSKTTMVDPTITEKYCKVEFFVHRLHLLTFFTMQKFTVLELYRNCIGNEGVKPIAEALKNDGVKSSYLSIACSVVIFLMQTLTIVELYYNDISDEGAQYLAQALQENRVSINDSLFIAFTQYFFAIQTLLALNLNCNSIGPEGARYLATALENNTVR